MIRRKLRDPNCQLCGLWESAATPCLWGTGPRFPKLMVVAESPGAKEDDSGKHLLGPAAKLLRELLEEAGLEEFYVTYAIKCKPPEEETPSASEIKTCSQQYLLKEIAHVKPDFVLSLGAGALKALSRGKITEMHGSPIALEAHGHSYQLYPTFHPAIALRDPNKLGPLRRDLLRLGRLIRGEQLLDKEIHWKVIKNLTDWNSFIEEFADSPEVGIDTETTGLDREAPGFEVNSLQVSLASGRNFAIPFCVRESPWNKKFQRMFLETLVKASKGKVVVMQNGKFDNLNLRKRYGVQFHLSFDTMLAHHLLDENSPHGLDAMAIDELDAPQWDIDLQTKLGLGNLEEFYKYGCYDVYYTLRLYWIFRARLLKQPGLRRLFYKLVMPIARVFEDVEERGHFINRETLNQVQGQLEQQSQELLTKLKGFGDINWNSPKQIGSLLFGKLGIPVLEKTPGGDPSTAESTLLRIEHPAAKLLMEYRGVEKNLSTYILGWQGKKTVYDKKTGERSVIQGDETLMHEDLLYLSTKIHGTVTGRYANRLHQVPRDPLIRSLIDAPEGYELIVADYSQIELRLAAEASQDQRMLMVFKTGGDIHAETASQILGIDPKRLTKEQRKMGKPVNFGFLYGMGWAKFGVYSRDNYGVVFSDSESKAYRQRFFEVYSALPDWHKRQRRCVNLYGEVQNLAGRIRHLPGIYSTDQGVRAEAERQSINAPIQGFGSGDLKAMAMIEIHHTIDRELLCIKGEVHDSILFWLKKGHRHLLPQVKRIMESPSLFKDFRIRLGVPLVVDFEIGPWGNGESWVG